MEKLSLARYCNFREHWRYYVHVAYVHGLHILWCNKCEAVALRKVDKSGPKYDHVIKVAHILKDLTVKFNLKGKALLSSWLINYIEHTAEFEHPSTVRNALGWLVMAHSQVMGLSFDGILTMEQGALMIRDDKLIPSEVYVIKPDISGDPEYLPIAFECPTCRFSIPVSDVEYGEKFACPQCWGWYAWYDTLSEPHPIPPPSEHHANLCITTVDVETGEPVKGAQVNISTEDFPDFKYYALTDENGIVSFNVPRWRKLVVEVIHQDYKTSSVCKTLILDTNESLTVSLKKPTVWDYVLPIATTIAVVSIPLIVVGLAEASKVKK